MKKKILIPVALILTFLLILFTPIYKGTAEDGGTRVYEALSYKIVVWNRINIDPNNRSELSYYKNTAVYWYPDNRKSLDELWKIQIENE